jgi:cobalt-zinc-cadmium efflux system membrane fusion protein
LPFDPRAAFVLLLVTGCRDQRSEAARQSEPVSAADNPSWGALQFARAARHEPHWTDWIPARNTFDEEHTTRLGAPLGGRITDVWFERGQHVAAGAKLLAIASADLAELRTQHDKAAVELATARDSLLRTQALVAAQSLPAKELITAQQAVAEADLAVRTSSAKLASLHIIANGAAAFTLTSPRGGVVVERNAAVGQQVSPTDSALVAIADLDDVWVVADMRDGTVGHLVRGTKAQAELPDGSLIDGAVDQVSAIVDPDRHTVPVRVRIENTAGRLRPNGHAQLRFFDDDVQRVVVPTDAVLTDGARMYVYIREVGSIHRRRIVADPPEGDVRAIRSGLAVGDEVVVRGAGLLDNQLPETDENP